MTTEKKNYCNADVGHLNTGNEDCSRVDMNSDECHAYNNGKCMNGFICPPFPIKQARADAEKEASNEG